ncbi:MAG: SOS response-associated peptidase [Bacilli bacterium]
MCGRFSLNKSKDEVEKFLFDFFSINDFVASSLPKFNIAPSQLVTAIIFDGINYRSSLIKWGLEKKITPTGNSFISVNARSETLMNKPMFKNLLSQKRCLIVADGFYEWEKKDGIPYHIFLENHRLFTMAGLWDSFINAEGKKISTCTIITTKANSLIEPIHERMPVIFDYENQKKWLSNQEKNEFNWLSWFEPYPGAKMGKYPITKLINNPANDSIDVLNPLIK